MPFEIKSDSTVIHQPLYRHDFKLQIFVRNLYNASVEVAS